MNPKGSKKGNRKPGSKSQTQKRTAAKQAAVPRRTPPPGHTPSDVANLKGLGRVHPDSPLRVFREAAEGSVSRSLDLLYQGTIYVDWSWQDGDPQYLPVLVALNDFLVTIGDSQAPITSVFITKADVYVLPYTVLPGSAAALPLALTGVRMLYDTTPKLVGANVSETLGTGEGRWLRVNSIDHSQLYREGYTPSLANGIYSELCRISVVDSDLGIPFAATGPNAIQFKVEFEFVTTPPVLTTVSTLTELTDSSTSVPTGTAVERPLEMHLRTLVHAT